MFNLDTITAFAQKVQKEAASGQTDLFGMLGDDAAVAQPTMQLMPSPNKNEKEYLTWERELMGLYISAHPLDAYATYLLEQTQPLTQLVPEYDGRVMTVGGIITTVRTIITKSGSKMAFVGLEDKFGEGEVIVFPNLYEQVGAKLVQDAVIRVTGKNSARDRDGNLGSESKMIADEIEIITDNDITSYESTGRKMDAPKVSAQYKKEKRANFRAQKTKTTTPATAKSSHVSKPTPQPVAPETPPARLFLQVKDPSDHDKLISLKKICSTSPGITDVVLVLGENDHKSAIRLPFKVDPAAQLLEELKALLGEECIKLA